jgi:hypothetical protein
MATKPAPKKSAAKKPASVAKKPAPAVKSKLPVKPKPAAKPATKPAPKEVTKPVAKPTVKVAVKAVPVKPAPAPAKPVDAVQKPAPKIISVAAPEPVLDEMLPVLSPSARLLPGPKGSTTSKALTLSVQTSQGAAGNGNTHPANILVVVTCGGTPITELTKDHFTLMEHFEVPGQVACFSNNITSFRNAGTGAYLLQTKPNNGAPWRSGHHLGQLLVSTDDDEQGQAAIKMIIR